MADPRKRTVTPQDAKRIVDTVRYSERSYKNQPPARGRGPAFNNPGVKYALTGGSGISAFSGSTPGSGTVTLYSYQGPGHPLVITSIVVTVSNAGGSIASGKVINVAFGDGGWHVVVVPC